LKLNEWLIGVNVDASFCGAIKSGILQRYLGRCGATAFLKWHEQGSSRAA
jgi:hypothetical protein